jgi:predicted secreted Zn-dependent protease
MGLDAEQGRRPRQSSPAAPAHRAHHGAAGNRHRVRAWCSAEYHGICSDGCGGCTLREVRVSVHAEIVLPRWTPPADADSSVVTEWTRFIAALETHEAGHKDIWPRGATSRISCAG